MNKEIKYNRKQNFQNIESEGHFYNLFINAPVALIEVDYSKINHYLKKNKMSLVKNLENIF